ncbi:50S ribosomal protein L22 [Candidatus Uhrbacteria bacterium]|nr:50S ribosomal protein L22 [Candidatus Uhrbacteria bacterium]
MQVTAHLERLRMAPRKVRLVAGLISGMNAVEALAQLTHLPKAAARPMAKLLTSAVANAEHNATLDRANLFVRSVQVDGGATLKRFRPRAFGRAASIRKRTCHVTIVLDERVPTGASPKKEQQTIAPPVEVADRPHASAMASAPAVEAASAPAEPAAETHAPKPSSPRRVAKRRQPEQSQEGTTRKRGGGVIKRFLTRRTGEK